MIALIVSKVCSSNAAQSESYHNLVAGLGLKRFCSWIWQYQLPRPKTKLIHRHVGNLGWVQPEPSLVNLSQPLFPILRLALCASLVFLHILTETSPSPSLPPLYSSDLNHLIRLNSLSRSLFSLRIATNSTGISLNLIPSCSNSTLCYRDGVRSSNSSWVTEYARGGRKINDEKEEEKEARRNWPRISSGCVSTLIRGVRTVPIGGATKFWIFKGDLDLIGHCVHEGEESCIRFRRFKQSANCDLRPALSRFQWTWVSNVHSIGNVPLISHGRESDI